MLRSIAHAALIAFFATAVSGCNTVQGFGQDLKAAGDALQRAADRTRSN